MIKRIIKILLITFLVLVHKALPLATRFLLEKNRFGWMFQLLSCQKQPIIDRFPSFHQFLVWLSCYHSEHMTNPFMGCRYFSVFNFHHGCSGCYIMNIVWNTSGSKVGCNKSSLSSNWIRMDGIRLVCFLTTWLVTSLEIPSSLVPPSCTGRDIFPSLIVIEFFPSKTRNSISFA